MRTRAHYATHDELPLQTSIATLFHCRIPLRANCNRMALLSHCTRNTNMVNVFAVHNEDSGIYLVYSTDTNMMNVFAAHNGGDGIYLYSSANTNMMNVSAALNQINAITMSFCLNTILYYSYTYAYHNGNGIYITTCRTTHVRYHNTRNTMHNYKKEYRHLYTELSTQ